MVNYQTLKYCKIFIKNKIMLLYLHYKHKKVIRILAYMKNYFKINPNKTSKIIIKLYNQLKISKN